MKPPVKVRIRDIIASAAQHYGLSIDDLWRPTRGKACDARRVVYCVASTAFHRTDAEIARAIKRDTSTVRDGRLGMERRIASGEFDIQILEAVELAAWKVATDRTLRTLKCLAEARA